MRISKTVILRKRVLMLAHLSTRRCEGVACGSDGSGSMRTAEMGARQQMAAEHRLRQQQAMVGERERAISIITSDCA